MPTYNCANCGQQFKGSEFLDECPNCSSEDFQKVDPPVLKFFKRAWPFLIVIGVLALAIPYLLPLLQQEGAKGSAKDSTQTQSVSYELAFEPFDKGIAIKLEEWKKTGNGYKVNPLSETKVASLIDKLNIRASDNMGRKVTLKNGKFYPCPNDNTDTLLIKWNQSQAYPIRDRNETKAVKYFTLKAEKPHPKANCEMPEPPLKITNVSFSATNCRISVQTNRKNTEDILVSITGKDGNYEAKNTWEASEINEYNIWALEGGDTVGYILNGNPIGECVDCNQAKMDKQKAAAIKAANAYGKNPTNLTALSKFKKLIDASNTDFYVDGNKLGGWSDFYNKAKLRYENENVQYEVKSIQIERCKIRAVKFVSKNNV